MSLLHLKKWLKDNVLSDEELIVDLLVDVDTEARGFLFESEFKKCFNHRAWHTPLAVDLIELLQQRHQTAKEAYHWMCSHRDLDYRQFCWAIEQLLGKDNRYSKKEYEQLWHFLVGSDKTIAWTRFERTFGKGIRDEWRYQPPQKHPYYRLELQEEEAMVMKLAQNRKCLTERLEQYARRGFVEYEVAERILKDLMDSMSLRFEDQLYRKVV